MFAQFDRFKLPKVIKSTPITTMNQRNNLENSMLPSDNRINTQVLAQIFNNTVATYKYYWFLSLLDQVVLHKKKEISFWEIIIGMIADAWYPIHYFRLSFGNADSLYDQIKLLQTELNIPVDANKTEIKALLSNHLDSPRIISHLRVFSYNVPYRFLSPWITFTYNADVVRRSVAFENQCIYGITGDSIKINPDWMEYLQNNYQILRDFTFWNLATFLQKRNPNVPDILSKLVKPIFRDSLLKQRHYWDTFIDIHGPIKCIYTGKELVRQSYDLDHFLPWSFVAHNLIWNLIPSDSCINSSKSNNIPALEKYLKPYVRLHQEAFHTLYEKNRNYVILEDFLSLHNSLSDIYRFNEDKFYEIFKNTLSPMAQFAENRGFKFWIGPSNACL